ncbi:CBS domain-containing protein [Methylocystis bryophila]|uniref:CBS domain-containing protein n=1 Tax=Methylocystis bryophila TaxID=655015 RepID=UPI000A26FAB6|nr:CBS domain-containing protein [Methylocystis bryophila]BDV37411.1 hypothetical protein DSM21852_06640 [Methylocystis bryophila]
MKIKDRPEFAGKPQAFSLRGEETVATAVTTMVERNIGSVVIVDADMKVQGIVTERDILRFVAENLDPKATPLSSVMSTEMKTARLDDDDMEWLQHMSQERFRHLPIVDDQGRLIGLLSQGDFVAQTWEDLLQSIRKKTQATFRQPTTQVVGALVLYTFAIIVMSRFWQGFSFR